MHSSNSSSNPQTKPQNNHPEAKKHLLTARSTHPLTQQPPSRRSELLNPTHSPYTHTLPPSPQNGRKPHTSFIYAHIAETAQNKSNVRTYSSRATRSLTAVGTYLFPPALLLKKAAGIPLPSWCTAEKMYPSLFSSRLSTNQGNLTAPTFSETNHSELVWDNFLRCIP